MNPARTVRPGCFASRGTGAMLCYIGHVLTDNRHGLVVNAQVTQANGTAERDTAAEMLADAAQFADTSITVRC